MPEHRETKRTEQQPAQEPVDYRSSFEEPPSRPTDATLHHTDPSFRIPEDDEDS